MVEESIVWSGGGILPVITTVLGLVHEAMLKAKIKNTENLSMR